MPDSSVVSALASAFLAGEATVGAIEARANRTLGRKWRWLGPLAKRYVAWLEGRPRPRHRDVVEFLRTDRRFPRAQASGKLKVAHWLPGPQRMSPVAAAAGWDLPAIETPGMLAEWLEVTPEELEWFADWKGLCGKSGRPKLEHYHYRLLTKRYGNIRVIEAPKPRLKEMQRRILARILERIPPHAAAHGFVKGRSIRTFAAPHTGRDVVLRMDLRDFFPTFRAARIEAFFRTAGYPEPVTARLSGICTNVAPRGVWRQADWETDRGHLRDAQALYGRPHLPQGAPSSPALANLCAYRTDCRLAGLAQSAGAVYTRYADDLAFSGGEDFARRVDRFSAHAAAILGEEGFHVHHRKTRVMRQGVRQHLAGLVTNQHLNVTRVDFDRLKAILTNCVRQGPETQNREGRADFRAHLEGRVAFVESINPSRGQRLRAVLEAIRWK